MKMIRADSEFADSWIQLNHDDVIRRNHLVETINRVWSKCRLERDERENTEHVCSIGLKTPAMLVSVQKPNAPIETFGFDDGLPKLIGRSRRSDIRLLDPEISSVHACLIPDRYGSVWIMDLGSRNGITCNNAMLGPFRSRSIARNDVLLLGDNALSVEYHCAHDQSSNGCWSKPLFYSSYETGFVPHGPMFRCEDTKGKSLFIFTCDPFQVVQWLVACHDLAVSHECLTRLHPEIATQIASVWISSVVSHELIPGLPPLTILRQDEMQYPVNRAWTKVEVMAYQSDRCFPLRFEILPEELPECTAFHQYIRTHNPGLLEITDALTYSVSLVVEVENCFLPDDVGNQLTPGDLVLLGKPGHLTLAGVMPSRVFIHPGSGKSLPTHWVCTTTGVDGRCVLTVCDNEKEAEIMKGNSQVKTTFYAQEASQMCETKMLCIAEIPMMDLRIELCRLSVSVRQLMDWGPGMTIFTDRKPDDPVVLRCGDRWVGNGRLVLIDGELGVEITERVKERNHE
ncbi:FliM/FliN family flagellar motor switch protein [bacterium]|nr:FliM/FliN family flagellar motor switch protein [candidate division CSSED10-310 bacterium]